MKLLTLRFLIAGTIFLAGAKLEASCLFALRNTYNHLFNQARITAALPAIENFLQDPTQPLTLSSVEISSAFSYLSSGQFQDVYSVSGGNYVIKLPQWRSDKESRSKDSFEGAKQSVINTYETRRIAEAEFSEYVAPSLYGVAADGIPFTLQRKVKVPLDPIRQKIALQRLVNKMRKEFPNLQHDKENATITLTKNGVRYQFKDVRHFNVGYFNGEPVMIDCPAFFFSTP